MREWNVFHFFSITLFRRTETSAFAGCAKFLNGPSRFLPQQLSRNIVAVLLLHVSSGVELTSPTLEKRRELFLRAESIQLPSLAAQRSAVQ